jgi:hypothetical protein
MLKKRQTDIGQRTLQTKLPKEVDTLEGLKENVIVGRLIPAGTGAAVAKLRQIAAMRDTLILAQKAEEAAAAPALPLAAPATETPVQRSKARVSGGFTTSRNKYTGNIRRPELGGRTLPPGGCRREEDATERRQSFRPEIQGADEAHTIGRTLDQVRRPDRVS